MTDDEKQQVMNRLSGNQTISLNWWIDIPLSLRLQVTLEWLTILHWILRGLIVFEEYWDLSEGGEEEEEVIELFVFKNKY